MDFLENSHNQLPQSGVGRKEPSFWPHESAVGFFGPEPPRKWRVLVVDRQPLFREGLVQFIRTQQEFVVCSVADSAAAARAAVVAQNPDIVVLALQCEVENGLELVQSLKTEFPRLRILVTSDDADELCAERALCAGVDGYFLKSEPAAEALLALQTVLRGDLYIPRSMASPLLKRVLQRPVFSRAGLGTLTDQESHVVDLLGVGLKTSEIGRRLHVSRKTVEAHRQNIKHKLRLHSVAALTRYACERAQKRFGSLP